MFALVGALVPLVYAVLMLFDFDTGRGGLQYVTDDEWIPDAGHPLQARRRRAEPVADRADHAAVRGLGAVAGRCGRSERAAAVRAPLRASRETAVLGAFLAQDLALFVLFFDLMLVPFYFLVGQWGGPDRIAAALKMVIYTLVGSLLMLAGAVATAVLSARGPGRADLRALATSPRNLLPETHAEAGSSSRSRSRS